METAISVGEYRIDGVRVETAMPETPSDRPPLVFVHGGCHGSWSWRNFLPFFAEAGWECYALNWFNHNGSDALPEADFVRRSIAAVSVEIRHVAGRFGRPPVLIGHSMGGLASQKYAEAFPTAALVLLTPVVPAEVAGAEIPLPVDFERPWGPPPFEATLDLFFQNTPEDEARAFYSLLCPESPRAVFEATRWTVPLDKTRISGPILVVAAEKDILTPPATGRALADFLGADYRYVRGRGHNLLLEPEWRETATMIAEWLGRQVGEGDGSRRQV
jgi:pimeloyl-ACP methyl ester carboxylesterase